jgi:hypothetical protein
MLLAPGTLIIANVPLPPAIYRELRSQAAKVGQKPAQFMAPVLTRDSRTLGLAFPC